SRPRPRPRARRPARAGSPRRRGSRRPRTRGRSRSCASRSRIPPGPNARRVDDSGHGHDLLAAHDERPRFALGSRDLGVDEHVLDLLAASGEPVAGPPATYLKACELRFNPPPTPADVSVQRDRGLLEPDAVVFADRGEAVAEVDPLRAGARGEEVVELRRALFGE